MADSVELFERFIPAGPDEAGALETWLVMERIARGDQRRDHADCNESSSADELPRDSAEAVDSSSSGSSTKASVLIEAFKSGDVPVQVQAPLPVHFAFLLSLHHGNCRQAGCIE